MNQLLYLSKLFLGLRFVYIVVILLLPISILYAQDVKVIPVPVSPFEVKQSKNKFVTPRVVPRDAPKKVVQTKLEVKMAHHQITKSEKVRLRCYNGQLVGPTIRVRPGDTLKVKLVNSIPKLEVDVLRLPNEKNKLNTPRDANTTNLHTHGLSVSPIGRSDNIFLETTPKDDETNYVIKIPEDHPPGTFWYHPHHHGSTAFQLCNGMAGALIVDPGKDGGIDDIPEVKAAMAKGREKILVLQEVIYSRVGDNVEVRRHDAYGVRARLQKANKKVQFLDRILINGVFAPVIHMKPGEIQRWRCIHAGITRPLHLKFKPKNGNQPDIEMHEIAVDGLALGERRQQTRIALQPGYRSDFLAKAPKQPGEYYLVSTDIDPKDSSRAVGQKEFYIARVLVKGDAVAMKLPDQNALKKYRLPSVKDEEVDRKRRMKFRSTRRGHQFKHWLAGQAEPNAWQQFDHERTDLTLLLGEAEEWTLSATPGANHPIHIHVNPFEVITKDKNGKIIDRVWRDTILVNDSSPVTLRIRFERFTGETVLHCHNLDHEDQGMMMKVNFVSNKKPVVAPKKPKKRGGFPKVPIKAPKWELPDPEGKRHKLPDYGGKDVMLVFFRGLGCIHCNSQLRAIMRRLQDFTDAKLTVIAISLESSKELKQALEAIPANDRPTFLLLADPSLATFKKYHCHDGRALHGTFLINPKGLIYWQDTGDDPYMDFDKLLAKRGKKTVPGNNPAGKNNGDAITILINKKGAKSKYIKKGEKKQNPVVVKVGQTVIWKNMDGLVHTATSGKFVNGNPLFDTGDIASGKSAKVVFDEKLFKLAGGKPGGTVRLVYYCDYHQLMEASILLKDDDAVTILINKKGAKSKYIENGETKQKPVVVRVGQTVIWKNMDGLIHTATSDKLVNGKSLFDTGDIASGKSAKVVFDDKLFKRAGGKPGGTVRLVYYCDYHQLMEAVILLKSNPKK